MVLDIHSFFGSRSKPRNAPSCHAQRRRARVPCFGRSRDASPHPSQQLYPHSPLLWWFGPEAYYGNYSWLYYNTWTYPASTDCQRLTPEPQDGSLPAYEQDDDMLVGRTWASSLHFLTGPCSSSTVPRTAPPGSPTRRLYVPSDALFPVARVGSCRHPRHLQPQRAQGFALVQRGARLDHIARMYHSVAFLLPDASVLIAGSNPNIDVELTAPYPTTYTAEIFYPPYFSSSVRPQVMGVPPTLSYGGPYFHLSVSSTSDTVTTWPPTRRSCSPGAASRRTREHGSAACAAQQFVQCQR